MISDYECSMKGCGRHAVGFVTIEFENEDGKKEKSKFGYCRRHWKEVKNYYKRRG